VTRLPFRSTSFHLHRPHAIYDHLRCMRIRPAATTQVAYASINQSTGNWSVETVTIICSAVSPVSSLITISPVESYQPYPNHHHRHHHHHLHHHQSLLLLHQTAPAFVFFISVAARYPSVGLVVER